MTREQQELLEAAKRYLPLLRLLKIGQIIRAGDEYINAAGLNPWCMNEGLATNESTFDPWQLSQAIKAVEDAQSGPSWDSRSSNHDDIFSTDRGGRL